MATLYSPPRSETPVSPTIPEFPQPASSRVSSVQPLRLSELSDGFHVVNNSNATQPQGSPSAAMAPQSPSPSLSSFSNSSTPNHIPATPINVHPPPAYVAAFGAAQVVNESKRHFSDDEGDSDNEIGFAKSTREDIQFSDPSLALVNAFLDQLLYSILLSAKSTTLTALRPAVTEVLRSRLAAEAIASAEEELAELLAGGDEEEEQMNQKQSNQERKRTWDTELVWKRTRLRVMVYIRLGEMEDEDEERFVRDDDLFAGAERRFSQTSGLVSWAAAIFLTSVLEYVAEQVLQAAGQAASNRSRRISRNPHVSASTRVDGVTVEEYDMEKVALSPTLGRLWRTWRKSLRGVQTANRPQSPAPISPIQNAVSNNFSHRLSRDQLNGVAMAGSPRRSSFGNAEPGTVVDESRPTSTTEELDKDASEAVNEEEIPEAHDYPEHVLAANIALPMANEEHDVEEIEFPEHVYAANIALPIADVKRDVDEIEVPGLAMDPDEDQRDGDRTPIASLSRRRSSWSALICAGTRTDASRVVMTDEVSAEPKLESEEEIERTGSSASAAKARPAVGRQRSASMPTRFPLPARMHVAKQQVLDEDILTPSGPDAAEVPAAETNDDEKPEPKANAAEMAPHKRMALPEKAALHEEGHDQATDPSAKKSVIGGAVTTAVAGAAAASATASAAVVSLSGASSGDSKSEEAEGEQLQQEHTLATQQQQEIDHKDSKNSITSTQQLRLPAADDQKSWNSEELKSPQAAKRLSLGQAVLVRAASQKDGRDSHDEATTEQSAVPESRAVRHGSTDLSREYTNESDHDVSDIGVARTSDTPVRTSEIPVRTDAQIHARENERDSFTNPAPRRPGRLVLDGTADDALSTQKQSSRSSQPDAQALRSPEQQFLERRSLAARPAPLQDLSSRESVPEDVAQPSPVRSSVPNSITTSRETVSPIVDKTPSPWRQSFPAALQNGSLWEVSPQMTASTSDPALAGVQEHPAMSKAALSREGNTKSSDGVAALTSASIKGPEDFEMFVQGGDTVKYTLTPESVRGAPSPVVDAAPYLKQSRSIEKIKQSPLPPPTPGADTRSGRSQTSRQATAAADEDLPLNSGQKERPRSISRPPVRNTSVHRKSGLMAREPQVVTESTRDFADFIRSTGPQKEPQLRPLVSHRSTASLASLRDAHINGARSQSPGAPKRSMSRGDNELQNAPPVPPMPVRDSAAARNGMQPRDASVLTDEDNTAALIDFIRTGPNGAHAESDEKRQHRISRTIAPFRTTMDSDQMRDWGDRVTAQPDLKINTTNVQAPGAPSVKSASSVQNSYRTSANSRTVLLHQSTTSTSTDVHPVHSGQKTSLISSVPPKLPQVLPNDPPLSKTKVRSKDPYSIDFLNDEEDDDLLTALPKNQRVEESLMEFLRNSEPPQNNDPKPIANGKLFSGPRRGSAQGLKILGADAVSMGRQTSSASTQPKSPISNALPRTGSAAIAVGPITKPRPKLEARDNTDFEPKTGTGDLADFLRTSEPPPANKLAASQSVPPRFGLRLNQRSDSKGSVSALSATQSTQSKASMTSSQKRSRLSSFFGGGLSAFFSSSSRRGDPRKGYLDM